LLLQGLSNAREAIIPARKYRYHLCLILGVFIREPREICIMMTRRILLLGGAAGSAVVLGARWWMAAPRTAQPTGNFPVTHSEAEWKKLLTPDQYAVLRKAATEMPYTSPLLHETRNGTFDCAGCDLALFSSTTKFDSGTGWPSFWAPLKNAVGTTEDTTFGLVRTAVYCSSCGGHLGHVFDDGPQPTGLRYCMNGVALSFKPATA
jgi:peptide-methionine (R)-S-oxide reductase